MTIFRELYGLFITLAVFVPLFGTALAADRVVLIEFFNNYGCLPCVPAAQIVYDLIAHNGTQLIGIECHVNFPAVGDPFYQANPADHTARQFYYQVGTLPTALMDGHVVPDPTQPAAYEALFDKRISIPSGVALAVRGTYIPAKRTGELVVRAIAEEPGTWRLRLAITEDDIVLDPPGPNGMSVYKYILRRLLPTPDGMELIFSGQSPDTLEVAQEFFLDPFWSEQNVSVVAFVQNDISREIEQASTARVSDFPTSVSPSSWGAVKVQFRE